MSTFASTRRIVVILAVAATLLTFAVPAIGGSRRGSIKLTEPLAGSVVSGTVPVTWKWKTGRQIDSRSTVDVLVSTDGFWWNALALGASVRDGEALWDTTAYPDGLYELQVDVEDSILSDVVRVTVDNSAPEVRIERPSVGEIMVEDETVARIALVSGKTTLIAAARDRVSGIRSVVWKLDGAEIATGARAEYIFGRSPGKHLLTAVATDLAGNTAEHEIEITTAPGPSTVSSEPLPLPESPSPDPAPAAPQPDATPPAEVTLPEIPALPVG